MWAIWKTDYYQYCYFHVYYYYYHYLLVQRFFVLFKKRKFFLWSFTFIGIAKERKLRKFAWVESPKNFPFYNKRSGFCFKQWILPTIMYRTNFENSCNRRFSSSIESYLGLPSFLSHLFLRLNSIVQLYYKQGPVIKSDSYLLIKNSVSNAKHLETHTLEKNALLTLH